MKNMKQTDDFEYEMVHDGLRHVLRLNCGDWWMVSYESFRVKEDKPLDDMDDIDKVCDMIDAARDGNEPMPINDMLIEADVAIAMGGVWAKLGREARRLNKLEEAA